MALFIVLVMLGICSSSYGLFLVYKVSTSVKGVDDVAGTAIAVRLNAYLLMNFDDEGMFQDANLILYGKDAHGRKVYFQLNDSDSNDFLDIGMQVVGHPELYFVVGIWAYGVDNPFEFEGCMSGKMKARDIGFGPQEQWIVPSSFKGVFTSWYDMLLDKDQDIYGTGNLSVKLDNKTTCLFNAQVYMQDQAVEYVIGLLQASGYYAGKAEVRVRQDSFLSADVSFGPIRKK